jgi:choline dehydrogenase
MDRFDYVIIGAGSAGSVLANRLSENPNTSVCVLEAGPRDWNPYIHIPAGFMKMMVDPANNWLYEQEPSHWTAGRRIKAPRGKTLGGSSSINGHIYNRGQRLDFNTWSQRGNKGWGYADVLPYFKRCENRIGEGGDTFRGKQGNLAVTDIDWSHPLTEAFIQACVEQGIPRNPDYNGHRQEGVNYAQRTIKDGRRMSAARAFLYPAMKRRNLAILTHAHATGLILDGKRVTGVRYTKGGRQGVPMEVFASKELILSGGTYNSPQLLQLSGIGNPEHLSQHGIAVRHGLPGVGENLRDHYAPRFAYRVKNADSINERARGLKLVGEIAKYFTTRKGILAISPTLVYGFWRSDPALQYGDIQFTFTPASYAEGVQSQLENMPGMTIGSWQQRPESQGWVRLTSADPFEAPLIQPNYLDHEEDRRVLLAAMKLARRIMASKALEPFNAGETYPGMDVETDEELMESARHRGTTTFHPMGTCRMGPDGDRMAVVDDQLRLRGLEGIRVVDASVMPTMPSANLNASTMMIAEKASDMILGRSPLEAVPLDDDGPGSHAA